ncbi:ricin B lectin (PTP6e) [Vairimorpha necatrix]|uniref:Ricin B lectin (PTP6e) n=1 Tax=Vairimorpha necatrix TaxID=6039 RepID=A0AAX4JEW0_9MICR
MIFIFFCVTLQDYIKHFNEDKFIQGSLSDGIAKSVEKSKVNERDDFRISSIWKEQKCYIYSTELKKVFSIGDDEKLKYEDKAEGKESERFGVVAIGPKTYVFKNNNKCIEYDKSSDTYLAKECSLSDNQKFIILYKIGDNNIVTEFE